MSCFNASYKKFKVIKPPYAWEFSTLLQSRFQAHLVAEEDFAIKSKILKHNLDLKISRYCRRTLLDIP